MNRYFTILLLLCFQLLGARSKDFTLPFLQYKVSNSLYNSVKFIDSREDTATMGFVRTGIFNTRHRVMPAISISKQVSFLMDSMIDATASNGELIFQLRRLRFSETTEGMEETGYCHFHAVLYARSGEKYKDIRIIDTIIRVKSKNVTAKLLSETGKMFTGFLESGLWEEPQDSTSYTLPDIRQISSIEKSQLPLYNTTAYVNGIYDNYKSFASQVPDRQGLVGADLEEIYKLQVLNDKGNYDIIQPGSAYAVVYKNRPYIAVENKYYALHKTDNDFYFFARLRKAKSVPLTVLSAVAFVGIITTDLLLFSVPAVHIAAIPMAITMGKFTFEPARKNYIVRVYHVDGKWIRLKY